MKTANRNVDPRIETLAITVPMGPTDNRRHIVSRYGGRLIASQEYRAWMQRAFFEVKKQLPNGWRPLKPTEGEQLPYKVKVFLPSRRMDAANYDKGLRDLFTEAGVWTDDKWALPQFAPSTVDPKHPRIIVTVPLSPITGRLMWPVEGLENIAVL